MADNLTTKEASRLRDEFAMAALPFLTRNAKTHDEVAESAYKWADVMLRVRDAHKPENCEPSASIKELQQQNTNLQYKLQSLQSQLEAAEAKFAAGQKAAVAAWTAVQPTGVADSWSAITASNIPHAATLTAAERVAVEAAIGVLETHYPPAKAVTLRSLLKRLGGTNV